MKEILVTIVSAVLLFVKGKQLNKSLRIFLIILLIISLAVVLFLTIMAIAFGSAHPPDSPVPMS